MQSPLKHETAAANGDSRETVIINPIVPHETLIDRLKSIVMEIECPLKVEILGINYILSPIKDLDRSSLPIIGVFTEIENSSVTGERAENVLLSSIGRPQ